MHVSVNLLSHSLFLMSQIRHQNVCALHSRKLKRSTAIQRKERRKEGLGTLQRDSQGKLVLELREG